MQALKLDLSSQKDIHRFAKEVNSTFDKIHFLINNAGILMNKGGKRVNSADGYEMVMATNYFGTFTLTNLLLDKIKSSGVPGAPIRSICLGFDALKALPQIWLKCLPEKPY